MPDAVSISLDFKDLKKALRALGEKDTRIATNQAINKTLTGIRTDATRDLAEKSQVKKQAAIRRRIEIKKSIRSRLVGKLVIPATDLALSNQKGVRVTGRGKNRRISWRGKKIKGFRIKGNVGNLKNDLFVRNSEKKLVRAYSYTLIQEYRKHKVGDRIAEKAAQRFQKEWNKSLGLRLRKLGFK